jgi:hypothetical protein
MEEKIVHYSTRKEVTLKDFLMKIREITRYLISKSILITVVIVIGGILGFVYSTFDKPDYVAMTTFVLENGEESGGLGQYAGLANMVGIDLNSGGGIFQGDNIIELYKSRSMLKKALLTTMIEDGKQVLLIDKYIRFNKLRDKWASNAQLKALDFTSGLGKDSPRITRLKDSVINSVCSDINKRYLMVGKPDKKLNIIEVKVTTANESFSKQFNDQIVKTVNDFYVQTKTKKSLENVSVLQQKVDSVRQVMNGAIYIAASVTDATPNLNPTRQIQRTVPVQRSQFTAETNKVILGELLKNLELSKIALRKETPLIQVIDLPVYPLEMHKLSKAVCLILGAALFGFFCVLFLVLRRAVLEVMKQ